ncbi:helix-turn-helix domain-containing protein [Lentzea sp. NPDC092896]|uniref:helix-turn-helix domain-containing protein n=1 Tax=Lentzea sp. NPDC092896 TaxID=3364127 RepID=UPI00381543F6
MPRRTAFTPIAWAKRVPTMTRADGRPDLTAHFVLLTLATYADKDGKNARPGLGTLAEDCHITTDTVQQALDRIQAKGLISKTAELTGGTTVWQLDLDIERSGRGVNDERRERALEKQRERQRRYEERRRTGSDGVAQRQADGAVDRQMTPSDDVSLTVSDTVTDAVADRHRRCGTPSLTVSPPSEPQVIPATPALDLPYELPKEQLASPTEDAIRDDVNALCERLHERLTANGVKATITAKWRTDARLLLDRDGRELQHALNLIDWATADSFWKANVLSMPKFRKQYDQLRLQALREWEQRKPKPSRDITAEWQALKQGPSQPGPSAGPATWQLAPDQMPLAATGTDALPLLISLPAPHSRGDHR